MAVAYGPAAGFDIVDALLDEPSLRAWHLLPAVRGDLLLLLGRGTEAARALRRAAELTRNERERTLLLERATEASEGDAAAR